jgi:hypothetical protein
VAQVDLLKACQAAEASEVAATEELQLEHLAEATAAREVPILAAAGVEDLVAVFQ